MSNLAPITRTDTWLDDFPYIPWDDIPAAHEYSELLLERLAADKETMAKLVRRLPDDPVLFAKCEHHAIFPRLTVYDNRVLDVQIRLHISHSTSDTEELLPHDHKYPFTTRILRGAYMHVWQRRVSRDEEDFTTADIQPATVTIERAGSCYTLDHSLVHQTLVQPGTVSLFMRGPKVKARSHIASDLVELVGPEGRPEGDYGRRPMSREEVERYFDKLAAWGLIGTGGAA